MVLTHAVGKYEFQSEIFLADRRASAARSGTWNKASLKEETSLCKGGGYSDCCAGADSFMVHFL